MRPLFLFVAETMKALERLKRYCGRNGIRCRTIKDGAQWLALTEKRPNLCNWSDLTMYEVKRCKN